jgi:hypothetical protein
LARTLQALALVVSSKLGCDKNCLKFETNSIVDLKEKHILVKKSINLFMEIIP